jgi:hypothetical protein
MPRPTISTFYAMMFALGAAQGCGAATPNAASAGDYDRPVPASEPRKTVSLVLDLPAASDCEERFDLAIYENRGIELVAWDESSGACVGRRVRIRYLTSALDEAALMDLVREHAKTAKKAP